MDGEAGLRPGEHRAAPIGVSELVRMVRDTLEENLGECWVAGEVSNARLAASNCRLSPRRS